MNRHLRTISRTWFAPGALLLQLDCGIARGPKPAVDSESHFLGCTSETDCGGIAGATCAGGWCVDVETGERIGNNALGNQQWDTISPDDPAADFPTNGEWQDGIGLNPPAAATPPGGSVEEPLDGLYPPPLPCYTSSYEPVPPYENQQQLNRLAGCEKIYGDLTITFDADLQALSSLRSLFGTLTIDPASEPLSSLAGLENLQLVSGNLILSNLGVSSLASLTGLQTVGAEQGLGLTLMGAPRLRDLSGLENLRALDSLNVIGLPRLSSLSGLGSLGRKMQVVMLQSLPALGGEIPILADTLTLDNTGIVSFSALQGASLTLSNNLQLTDVAVYNVDQLVLDHNPKLVSFTLPASAATAMSRLEVIGNASLQSIVDAGQLTTMGFLTVNENPVLQAVSLPWLQSLNVFQVIRNPSLASIELPLLVQQVEDLKVVSNSSLSMSSIFSITGRAKKYKLAGNEGDPLFLDPCPYVRDTFCDEPPVDSICAPGSDYYDCKQKP